jgi:hypothetical protein
MDHRTADESQNVKYLEESGKWPNRNIFLYFLEILRKNH